MFPPVTLHICMQNSIAWDLCIPLSEFFLFVPFALAPEVSTGSILEEKQGGTVWKSEVYTIGDFWLNPEPWQQWIYSWVAVLDLLVPSILFTMTSFSSVHSLWMMCSKYARCSLMIFYSSDMSGLIWSKIYLFILLAIPGIGSILFQHHIMNAVNNLSFVLLHYCSAFTSICNYWKDQALKSYFCQLYNVFDLKTCPMPSL